MEANAKLPRGDGNLKYGMSKFGGSNKSQSFTEGFEMENSGKSKQTSDLENNEIIMNFIFSFMFILLIYF